VWLKCAAEQRAALNGLTVLNQHLDDLPADRGRQLHHVGFDERIIRDRVTQAEP